MAIIEVSREEMKKKLLEREMYHIWMANKTKDDILKKSLTWKHLAFKIWFKKNFINK